MIAGQLSRSLLVASLVALLSAPTAQATPSTVATEQLSPATSSASDVDMGPDGEVLAAWSGTDAQSGKVIVATRAPGGDWTAGIELSSAAAGLSVREAELGPDGSAVVVATTSSFGNGRPYAFYRSPAGLWSSAQALSTIDYANGSSVYLPKAAYDAAGNITVAWRSNANVVAVSRDKLAGLWGSVEVLDADVQWNSLSGFDVDVDGAGNAIVVWGDGVLDDGGLYTQQFVSASTRTGPAGEWSVPVVIGDGVSGHGGDASAVRELQVDMNSLGAAVVSWQGWAPGNTNDRRVRAVMRESADGPWVAEQDLSAANQITGNETAVGIDDDGNATVLWHHQNVSQIVRTVRSPGGAWSSTTLSSGDTEQQPSISLDTAGSGAWVAVYDRPSYGKAVAARTAQGTFHMVDLTGTTYENLELTASIDAAGNGVLGWVNHSIPSNGASPRAVHAMGWDATGPQLTNLLLPTVPEAGQQLDFSVDPADVWSDAVDLTVTWDFGDASAGASGTDVTHTYAVDGTYTVTVTATDDFGNETEETRQLVVEPDQPPVVEITDGHPALSNDSDPSFAWTVDDGTADVDCQLDGPAGVLGPHPMNDCAGLSRSYSDLEDGDYTFTVQAEANGQVGDDNVNFTIDTTPPDSTQFTGGPDDGDRIKDRTPNFTFAAPGETDPEFECRVDSVDDADWTLCDDDGWQPDELGDGAHTVEVRAVDLAGNADGSPNSVSFVVDNVPPDTAVSAPAGPTKTSRLNFTLSAPGLEDGEVATYRCRIFRVGAGPAPDYAPCDRDFQFDVPADPANDGTWTLEALASDNTGNEDDDGAAAASVVVDRVAPAKPAIDSGPTGATSDRRPTFTFSGEAGAQFECRVQMAGDDVTAFSPCNAGSFTPGSDLFDGAHTFHVRAIDAAGNVGDAEVQAFSVSTTAADTTPPQTRIDSGPVNGASISDRRPSFAFSTVGGDGASYRCALHRQGETASFETCRGPFKPGADLAFGAWVFEVKATDAAGNEDASPATRAFTVVADEEPIVQVPPTFVPMDEAVTVGRMPALSAKQQGGRWSWQDVQRAEAKLADLNLNLDVRAVAIGAGKPVPKSLRKQLRTDEEAAGAVLAQNPVTGTALRGTPTQPRLVTLAYYDPAKDKGLQQEIEDDLAEAERRLKRREKKVPKCKYLIYTADNLMLELGAMTVAEARKALKREKCDWETRFKKAYVADELIKDVRVDKKHDTIELLVLIPKQSQFVITVREDPGLVDGDDLSFAATGDDGKSEWTLRTTDKQQNVFVAQVNELSTGRFVTGAKVELWEPGAEKPAFRGTTNGDGEVVIRTKLRTPGTIGLFAKVSDSDGDVMEGFRDLRAVDRNGDFTTPTGRAMNFKDGRWKGPKGEETGLAPANIGMGIAGPTVRTAVVSRQPVEYALSTGQGDGIVPGTSPAIDLSKGSSLVLAGKGALLASGGASLAIADGKLIAARNARSGEPVARASFFNLGDLAAALLYHFVQKPKVAPPAMVTAVKKAAPTMKHPGPQINSILTNGLLPGAMAVDGGGVLDTSGAEVVQVAKNYMVIRKNGVQYTLPVSNVISTGGGNLSVTLGDGSLLRIGGAVISTGGGNVISTGGGNVISTGGGNVIATGGGNVIATGGGNVISVGGGNVISTGGGNVISTGGGNVISTGGGNFMPTGAGVISVGGGNVISTGGGNVISTGGGNVISTGGGN